jgi:hypothetical protein
MNFATATEQDFTRNSLNGKPVRIKQPTEYSYPQNISHKLNSIYVEKIFKHPINYMFVAFAGVFPINMGY